MISMCLCYIHDHGCPFEYYGFFGMDITMDIAWILQPGLFAQIKTRLFDVRSFPNAHRGAGVSFLGKAP